MIQKFIQNYYLRLIFNIILACSVIYLLSYIINSQQIWISSNRAKASNRIIHLDMEDSFIEEMSTKNEIPTTRQIIKDSKDPLVKNRFERIYKNRLWSDAGDGSGAGSTISYTDSVRAILRQVIDDYSIESMLDAPCGSFLWMPLMLRNVTEDFKSRGKRFRYHGVDVVESLITTAKAKYSNESDWEFSVCDFSAEDLPNGYDLIFSRDALQHLSYEKVFYSLRAYSRVQGAKYLLVGSYFGNYGNNKNIEVGNTFLINLAKPPFNLNQYIRIYHENKTEYEPKSLILYDIPNYLSKVNFDLMKDNLGIKYSL